MTLQTRVKSMLDTDGHMVLPPALMNKINLKEKTEITVDYNGKVIIICINDVFNFDDVVKAYAKTKLHAAFKKMDAKNLKISDEEINKEIQAYRKEKRENKLVA